MKKTIAFILAFCITFSSICVPRRETYIYAETALQKAQNKKAELEKQLKEAQSKLKEYQEIIKSSEDEEDKLTAEANAAEAEKEVLAAQLLSIYADGEAIIAACEDAEREYREAEEEFFEKSRLMYLYSCKSPLEILAGSDSISDFFKRVKFILFVSEEDNEALERLMETKQEYEYKKQYQEECAEIINEMISDRELTLDNITLSKAELEEKVSSAQALMDEIKELEDSIEDDLDAVEAELKKLQDSGTNTSGGSQYTGGIMLWPVPYTTRISSGYGTRKDPITGATATHTGIDIPAPKGSAILAAADGVVTMSGVNGGFGNCIKIDHGGGILTLYGHCDELLVKVGEKVKKGDLIARVGTTGRSTGYHLHFEVRKNNRHVDPIPYLKG